MDEKGKKDFFLALVLSLWLILFSGFFTPFLLGAYEEGNDISFYYSGIGPDGNQLAYPSLALLYFQAIRTVSPDIATFAYVFEFLSLAFFAALFFVYKKIDAKQNLAAAFLLFAPIFFLVPLRLEIVPITLSIAGIYFFSAEKRLLGWFLVITAAFIKIFPVFLLPLFLVMELKSSRS
ncbi:hypothetical protein H0O02_04975, partial [Candidatus Micrarchaeota archaeon]|nr:hypothetical protein [Candidatus Micrarchaeota archaeon]